MDNKLLYNNIMKNIKYSLKSILNEDIQNFDIIDYSDDNIIDIHDIDQLSGINNPKDVLMLTKNFIKQYILLSDKLSNSLDNIIKIRKSKKAQQLKQEYISILTPSVKLYNYPSNNYDAGDDNAIYPGYENFYDNYIDIWNECLMFIIINNINYKEKFKKYKTIEYKSNVYNDYQPIGDLIDSKYRYSILYLDLNMDTYHHQENGLDYNGICRLLTNFYKANKPLKMYLDDISINIDYKIKKTDNIYDALDNFIELFSKYVDFIINNFEKYIDYTHKFDPNEYDPDTYLKLKY